MNIAKVVEIFSGIQGEGALAGVRQTFLRFWGCNLTCRFCDTPSARLPLEDARIERNAGSRNFEFIKNPISEEEILKYILNLTSPPFKWVSFTGGEPLLYVDFMEGVVPRLKKRGIRIYLETNGTLFREMKKIEPMVDIIAMDIKLDSSSGEGNLFDKHEKFLKAAQAEKKPERLFIKTVVTSDTAIDELEMAANLVSEFNSEIIFFIQPVTSVAPGVMAPNPLKVLRWQERLMKILGEVRVLPQTHRIIGQM